MDTFTIQDAPLNMAPTGIATFAKVPICYDLRQANADVAHDIRMNCFPSSFSKYLVFKNLIPVPKTLLGSY